MFPNFRLMGASTLVSILGLFFAFALYASLRVSHEPLAAPAQSARLQLVGLNVAMLPVMVLEPFARQHSGSITAAGGSVFAYSAAQASEPPLPVTNASGRRDDNAATDPPSENGEATKTNSDVTKAPDAAGLEAAREPRSPDEAMQETVEPAETLPPSVTESAALPAPTESAPLPASPPQATSALPQNSRVERTAVIEALPATALGDDAVAAEIPVKEKKKRVVRRHIYRAPPRAVAQTSAPQATSYPAGIGGPFVSAK